MTAVYPLDADGRDFLPAAPHPDESERIAALHSLELLDSAPAVRFDTLTALVAEIFDVPTALISLIDSNRQWFLSRCGLDVEETGRDVAFCSYAIHEEEILVIQDASIHPLFLNNPLVTGEPHIRFYAGAVIRDVSGLPLGTLCIIDTKPRDFGEKERRRLVSFAHLVREDLLMASAVDGERRQEQQLAQLDPITHAFWGEAFYTAARKKVLAGQERPCLIAAISFDNLDFLSDAHGRMAADEMLLELAKRIELICSTFGDTTMGRLSGKRLVCSVVLDEGVSGDDLPERCQNALQMPVTNLVKTSAGSLQPLTTVAIAMYSDEDESLRDALNLCRIAAAQIPKDAGRRSVIVGSETRENAWLHFKVAADLPDALGRNELKLNFQPKVDAVSRKIVGAECLVRWQHPTFGNIAPPDIVSAATDAHRLLELDTWVIRSTISQIAEWRSAGIDAGPVSVNLSGSTLANRVFPNLLQKLLAEKNLSGECIDLEIVESSLFNDFDIIVAAMRRIRTLGVTFSLDDFGTGYSALSYLRELPIDNLKIDKAFVDNIVDDPRAASLCAGILTLAGHLGMKSVAEGVESQMQYLILRAMRCDQIQGYYFSRPVPAGEFLALLQSAESMDSKLVAD